LFSIELYLADTSSGEVRKRISNAAMNPRVDSLMFIYSAGAWDASGRRFVHGIVERGSSALLVRDVASGRVEQDIPMPKMGEIYNPTWSPDGQRIAFSALAGGLTDLYVYDLGTKQVTRLTEDAYADLQPAWSPDGKTIAFVTDRFSSNLQDLRFGNYRLALIDPSSKVIEPLPAFDNAKNINPQWSADGASLFFISDREGVSNVYRLARASGELFQVTDLTTGVSGLTPLSPALSSASASSRLTFTAYQADRYALYSLDDAAKLAGQPVERGASASGSATLPPGERSYDQIVAMKRDVSYGLPSGSEFRLTPYHPKLALDYVSQPSIGVGMDRFGSYIGGGTSLRFSDMLGDHNMSLTFQANGGFSDIAALASYVNLRSRLNWGAFLGQVPDVYSSYAAGYTSTGQYEEIDYIYRQINRQVGGMAAYPFSRAQRIEAMGGLRRVSFEQEIRTSLLDPMSGQLLDYQSEKSSLAPALNLAEGNVALVYDTSIFGATSPLLGRAYRLEAGAVAGSLSYRTLLGDVRQYVMPIRPFTLATRVLFYGRVGSGANDDRLSPIYLGYPGLVRGYDVNSFSAEECETTATSNCSIIDRIGGSRLLIANVELRFPLLGLFGGDSYFGPFPVEGAVFFDGGTAWSGGKPPKLLGAGHKSVSSVGAGLRVNVFGFAVVEIDYVKPFDRPVKGAHWQFSFMPGF
jgi:hypothetical protein